ncbi:hypothetical protein BC829DRAFT_415359 [Chytridium lagenaria]|nr:hypothetical protein BC829DRAFT_415359 [Chytridium lagenaria]
MLPVSVLLAVGLALVAKAQNLPQNPVVVVSPDAAILPSPVASPLAPPSLAASQLASLSLVATPVASPTPVGSNLASPAPVASPDQDAVTTTVLILTTTSSPTPTVLPGGYPAPDPTFQNTATGRVNILAMPYLIDPKALAYQKTFDATPPINISHTLVADAVEDDAYVQRILKDCEAKTGDYDVVVLNTAFLGPLGDCFLDLSGWDRRNADGFVDRITWMNTVNERLVGLPLYSDYGVMFYNQEVLELANLDFPPLSMDEFEETAMAAVEFLRMSEKANVKGLTTQLEGEALTIATAEWLYGQSRTSIVDIDGNVGLATNQAASILNRVFTWSEQGILDLEELEYPKAGFTQLEVSIDKFIEGKAVFMRHWSSAIQTLRQKNLPFKWGVGPVVGTRRGQGVGALSGASVGVYRYSKNPSAAVKTAFWLTSVEYQKALLTKLKLFFIPTRSQLLIDSQVCQELTVDLCQIFAMNTPALRPTAFAGRKYRNVTNIISSTVKEIILGGKSVKNGLEAVDAQVRTELGISLSNNSIIIGPTAPVTGRKNPTHVEVQLSGLILVIIVTTTVVILLRNGYLQRKKNVADAHGFQKLEDDHEGGDEEKGEMKQISKEDRELSTDVKEKEFKSDAGIIQSSANIESVSDLGVDRSERAAFL